MSIRAWEEERLRIRAEEALLNIEAEQAAGIAHYTSMAEAFEEIDRVIIEAEAVAL